MTKKRIAYIDLLKIIAIFMVITLHSGTWQTDFIKTGNWQNTFQYCVRMLFEGVPLFMMINGFLIFNRPFDARKHLKRTVSIVFIILIWSVIMDVYFTLIEGSPLTFKGVMGSVLNTNIANAHTGVLWFLQKLIVVYILFPILKYIYDSETKLFDYLLLVLIISTYSINLISLASGVWKNEWLDALKFFFDQYSIVIGTNIYVIYFMLGGYLCKNINRLPKIKYIILGLVTTVAAWLIGIGISVKNHATFSSNYNFNHIFLMFTMIALLFVCSYIPLGNRYVSKLLASIGDNTMGIYLIHRMVIVAIEHIAGISFLTMPLVVRLAFAVLVLIVSWLITLLIRMIPKISFIVKL